MCSWNDWWQWHEYLKSVCYEIHEVNFQSVKVSSVWNLRTIEIIVNIHSIQFPCKFFCLKSFPEVLASLLSDKQSQHQLLECCNHFAHQCMCMSWRDLYFEIFFCLVWVVSLWMHKAWFCFFRDVWETCCGYLHCKIHPHHRSLTDWRLYWHKMANIFVWGGYRGSRLEHKIRNSTLLVTVPKCRGNDRTGRITNKKTINPQPLDLPLTNPKI